MKILVTGGAGFVGSHLVSKLSLNHNVTILDNSNKNFISHLKNITIHKNNILNITRGVDKYDIVFHLAAKPFSKSKKDWFTESSSIFQTNVIGTHNILHLTKPNCHFIFTSSASVYGEGRGLTEENPYNPLSAYGYSKALAEQVITNSNRHYTILRPATIIGPHGQCFPNRVMWSIINNQPCTFFKSGHVYRDIIDVRDVVEALIQIMNTKTYGIYNLGTNKEIKGFFLSKHAERIAKRMEMNFTLLFTPFAPKDFVINSTLNSNKLFSTLHWAPVYTLPESLKTIFNYYYHNPQSKEPPDWDAL